MVASTANITMRIDLTGQSDLLSPSRLVHQSGVLAGQVVRPGGAPQRGEVQPALLMNHVSHLQVVQYEREEEDRAKSSEVYINKFLPSQRYLMLPM